MMVSNFYTINTSSLQSSLASDFQSQLEAVEVVLRTLLQFCQRNSVRADEKRREAMWLPVFKLLLTMLYEYREPLTNLLKGERHNDIQTAYHHCCSSQENVH